jgi:hypothetical protein
MSELDPKIEAILQKTGDKYGLPREIWYPIVMLESGGSTTARANTSSEDSRGLFQVNIYAHPDANSVQLYDPEYNANYQMPELKKYYDEGLGKGLTGSELVKYVERYGQRPKWTEDVERAIDHYYSSMTQKDSLTGSVSGAIVPGQFSPSSILSWSDPSTWFPATKSFLAYGGITIFLVLILFFSFYMVFVRNSSVEKIATKLI